jgi:uncharacterized protein YutE (UPF0331/DUF86 family)
VTDHHLIAKRLALVESVVADLRRLARLELIATDVKEQRFVEHSLQIAIQACLDCAFHIIADEKLGEPQCNGDAFRILARTGWLQEDQVASLIAMAGLRNILVHGYVSVDLMVVIDVVSNHLDDLLNFVAAVRTRLP